MSDERIHELEQEAAWLRRALFNALTESGMDFVRVSKYDIGTDSLLKIMETPVSRLYLAQPRPKKCFSVATSDEPAPEQREES